jgi:hypothetical protein
LDLYVGLSLSRRLGSRLSLLKLNGQPVERSGLGRDLVLQFQRLGDLCG